MSDTKSNCNDDENEFHRFEPGEQLNEYRIIHHVGQGMHGNVASAIDTRDNSIVAIKISRGSPDERQGAEFEVQMLEKLLKKAGDAVSCLLMLRDSFRVGPHICIVFDLLGKSLAAFLKENHYRPFPPHQIQHISHQLFNGVAFLHQNGVIHTDIKPDNILLVNDEYDEIPILKDPEQNRHTLPYGLTWANDTDEPWRILRKTNIRICDLGLAVPVTANSMPYFHQIQALDYRAPEVCLGLCWASSADIYSLGCVLGELRFGRVTFPSQNDFQRLCAMHGFYGQMPQDLAQEGAKMHEEYFYLERSISDTEDMETVVHKLNWRKFYDEPTMRYFVDKRQLYEKRLEGSVADRELKRLLRKILKYHPMERISAREALRHRYFLSSVLLRRVSY